MYKILIVDDEQEILNTLGKSLIDQYDIYVAKTYNEALTTIKDNNIDILITDINLNEKKNGIDLIRNLIEINSNAQSIILTGYPDLDTKLDSKHLGTYEYLEKPVNPIDLSKIIKRALDRKVLLDEISNLKKLLDDSPMNMAKDVLDEFESSLSTYVEIVNICVVKIDKLISQLELNGDYDAGELI